MATATDTATGADEAAAAAAAAAGNNPVILGSASFVAGAIPLALWLVGYKDFAVAGLLSNIILVAGLGLFIAAIWAINLGAGAVATVFGLFSMFWLSFALLVLGTTHGWFVSSAVEPEAAATAGAGGTIVYLITWTAAVVVLTLATLRLPLAFTALFALVALALSWSCCSTSPATPSGRRSPGTWHLAPPASGSMCSSTRWGRPPGARRCRSATRS